MKLKIQQYVRLILAAAGLVTTVAGWYTGNPTMVKIGGMAASVALVCKDILDHFFSAPVPPAGNPPA